MMNTQEVSLAMLEMGHNQANMMNRQGMGKSSNVTDGTQLGQHDEHTRGKSSNVRDGTQSGQHDEQTRNG